MAATNGCFFFLPHGVIGLALLAAQETPYSARGSAQPGNPSIGRRNIAIEDAIAERRCRRLAGTEAACAFRQSYRLGQPHRTCPARGNSGQSVRPDFSRCITLRDLLARYEHHTSLHTGQQARADLALDRDCRDGRYRDGIATLEAMLRRGLIPMPR